MRHNASKLLADAADCGLRITGLDGWTQTRLAKTLQIRRETLNAIINRSPGTEPTTERPKLVEACQKLIIFAAALSAKDDAVLKNPIDAANLQSDDGQAYEHHRLRLHRLVDAAVTDNQFTDALCRIGEFASAAMHAPAPFRLRMVCNLVTAIQRLLDKPGSREVPVAVLRANLSRLYRAERTARRCGQSKQSDSAVTEQCHYVRGQVGYGLVFSGMLLADARLVQRGGKRLVRAVAAQPDPSFGHWCNFLRATNDLMSSSPQTAAEWARQILSLANSTSAAAGFAAAYFTLQTKGEIQALRRQWEQGSDQLIIARLLNQSSQKPAASSARRATSACIGVLLMLGAMFATTAFAGDGRDFQPAQTQTTTPTNPQRMRGAANTKSADDAPKPTDAPTKSPTIRQIVRAQTDGSAPVTNRRRLNEFQSGFRIEIESDRNFDNAALGDVTPDMPAPTLVKLAEAGWGENIKAFQPPRAQKPAPAIVAQKPPESVPAPEARPAVVSPADKAASILTMAKNYVTIERFAIGRSKLEEVIKNYPSTPAAQEARELLAQLPSN